MSRISHISLRLVLCLTLGFTASWLRPQASMAAPTLRHSLPAASFPLAHAAAGVARISQSNLGHNPSVTTGVGDAVDLYIGGDNNPSLGAYPNPVMPPAAVVYNMVVGNAPGMTTAQNVQVTFNKDTNTPFIAAEGTHWLCGAPSGNQVVCDYTQPITAGTTALDLEVVVSATVGSPNTLLANATVTSTTQAEVDFSDNTANSTVNVVNCNPNLPDPNQILMSTNTSSVPADGTSYAEVYVQIRSDCPGNPMVTASSLFTLTSSRGASDTITLAPGYPNPSTSGIIAYRVRSIYVGTSNFSVQVNTGGTVFNGTNTQAVTFTSCNRPSATASTVTASPTAVPADGVSYSTVVVTLKDDCNNTVTASTLVTLTSSRGTSDTLALAPGSTNPTTTGSVSFRVRSTHAGLSTYSARSNTAGTVVNIVDTDNVAFGCNPNVPAPGGIIMSTNVSTVPADGSSYAEVYVTAYSECGTLLTASTYFTLTSSRGAFDTITLAPGYPNPSTSGVIVYRVRSLYVGTSTYSVQVSTGGNTYLGANTANVTFNTCNRPSATTSTITASPTIVPPNGTSYSTVVVTLKDDCNNNVTASTLVTLTSSRGPSDTIALAPGSSNPTTSGSVSFRVSSTSLGTSTYSARSNTAGTIVNIVDTDNVTFCNPDLPIYITLSANVTSVPADGVSYSDMFVNAYSSCGSLITATSFFTLTSSRGASDTIALVPGYPNPSTSGVAGFRVRSTHVGLSTYSVQVGTGGNTYNNANTQDINFTCSPAQVSPIASTVSAAPTSVVANGMNYAEVQVNLYSNCGTLVSASTLVTLTSSRGGLDVITLAPGATNPTTTGSVSFRVSSTNVGTSTYTAQTNTLGTVVNLDDTDHVAFVLLRWFLPFVVR